LGGWWLVAALFNLTNVGMRRSYEFVEAQPLKQTGELAIRLDEHKCFV
jgi:hypothetical protein